MHFSLNTNGFADYISELQISLELKQTKNISALYLDPKTEETSLEEIIQIRMNNICPNINTIIDAKGKVHAIVSFPDIYVALWLKNNIKTEESKELQENFFSDDENFEEVSSSFIDDNLIAIPENMLQDPDNPKDINFKNTQNYSDDCNSFSTVSFKIQNQNFSMEICDDKEIKTALDFLKLKAFFMHSLSNITDNIIMQKINELIILKNNKNNRFFQIICNECFNCDEQQFPFAHQEDY